MDLGILRVTTPDGQVREYPLDVASAFIGRAEGNRVVIDHVSVSRRHARLDFVQGQARLEDLSSATGTYASGQRLEPGTPRPVNPGETIRFGDCQAVLIAPAGTSSQQQGGSSTTSPPPTAGGSFAGRPEQAIAISVAAPGTPVAPGSAVTATVTVQNRGDVVDTVQVAILGLPETWVRVTRPVLSLNPEARDEVVVVIQPPRDATARAGEYQFAAAATSANHGVEVRALGRLAVLPFGAAFMEIRPTRASRDFTAHVENQSNTPVRVALAPQDAASDIELTFPQPELELEPGQAVDAPFRARFRNAGFFGSERRKRFTIAASGAGQPVSDDAELLYRPPWLLWRWIALAVLVVAVGLGGWFAYSALTGDDDTPASSDQTATPGPGTPTTAPSTATTPADTPTAPPDGSMPVGSRAVVINSPIGNCIRVRNQARVAAQEISSICDGDIVTIREARTEADNFYWYKVAKSDGIEGYASSGPTDGSQEWLTPAP